VRVTRTGSFLLPTSPEQAMPLFTAEGERAWAPGWEPTYYGPDGSEDVWTTGDTTYWLTVDRTPTSARYARVTPGDSAGTVAVSCAPHPEGTEVTVTYDLTALGPAGEERLAGFQDGYDAMLAHWRELTLPLVP
jgi:hypothetical protein